MWEKMVTKLEHGKKHILDLIEQSVAAYDQREELCHKIQNLNDKSQNENHSHMQEMRELQRQLDHDAKLQQFFAIKGNRRINAELEIRESNRRLVQQEQADQQVHNLQSILDQIQVARFIFIRIKINHVIMRMDTTTSDKTARIKSFFFFHRWCS